MQVAYEHVGITLTSISAYFTAKNQPNRVEFLVARKLARKEVPKLKSVALAIESTWGRDDDYGCLYRFRVHGDGNE